MLETSAPMGTLGKCLVKSVGIFKLMKLSREIDISNCHEIWRCFEDNHTKGDCWIIDMRKLTYIDSDGIVQLNRIERFLVEHMAHLVVLPPRALTAARRALSIAQFDQYVQASPSLREAYQTISAMA